MRRGEIRIAAQAAIGASVDTVLTGVPVVLDNQDEASITEMEGKLRAEAGVVIAIGPLLGSSGIGKVGQRFAEKAHLPIHLRTNRENTAALALADDRIDAILMALFGAALRAEFAGEHTTTLIEEDLGNLTYAIDLAIPFTSKL